MSVARKGTAPGMVIPSVCAIFRVTTSSTARRRTADPVGYADLSLAIVKLMGQASTPSRGFVDFARAT